MTLGGMATTGHVNLFEPMCNGRGTQIMKGMADEMLRTAIRYGYDDIPEDWQKGEPGQGVTNKRFVCHFSACIFALTLTDSAEHTAENGTLCHVETLDRDAFVLLKIQTC